MLTINPQSVTFAGAVWDNVTLVAIDRATERAVLNWSDFGPFAVLADVSEQRVALKVIQRILNDDLDAPRPAQIGALVFYTAPASSDARRLKVSCQAAIVSVRHEISEAKGAVRTIELAAVSPDGATDPITVSDAGGEA